MEYWTEERVKLPFQRSIFLVHLSRPPDVSPGGGSGSERQRVVIPAKLALASPSRNPGNWIKPGFPKFTDQVQHFLYKVLRWDRSMNSFHWNNVVPLPGIAKPGKQSAKSRQLWIARHRL